MGFEGGDNFLKAIDTLANATMRTGHRMAGDMRDRGLQHIETNTPVETYHLRRSYKKTAVVYRRVPDFGFQMFAWEGTVYTEVEYAPYVELGTGLWGPKHAKYEIKPKKPGGVLAFQPYVHGPGGAVILNVHGAPSKLGRTVMVRFVLHPGSPGNRMFQIGVQMTEMEVDEWSAYPLQLWHREVESRLVAA